MSMQTKKAFKEAVLAQQSIYSERLRFPPATFRDDGFVTVAVLAKRGGSVELWCGPAEYHVELFINNDADGVRMGLADLIALPGIREWMESNRLNCEGVTRVPAEVEYFFRFLAEAIGRSSGLGWLGHQ